MGQEPAGRTGRWAFAGVLFGVLAVLMFMKEPTGYVLVGSWIIALGALVMLGRAVYERRRRFGS